MQFITRLVAFIAAGAYLAGAAPALAAKKKKGLPVRSTSILVFKNDNRVLAVNRESDTLSVVEVRRKGKDVARLIAEVGVGHEPRCVALGPKEREAYVTNAARGTVSVVSLFGETANSVVAEIPIGAEPRGCATTPNGKRLFITLFTEGAVAVIDTESRQGVGRVPVGGTPA